MAHLIDVREILDHTLYSGWIADTRQEEPCVSPHVQFKNPLKLYVSDLGDQLRTNMWLEGVLPAGKTALIRQMGFHVSFSDPADYDFFFKNLGDGSSFQIWAAGEPLHKISTLDFLHSEENTPPKPTYSHGIRIGVALENPIPILEQMPFFVILETSKAFMERMRAIESGDVREYAEIKSFLKVKLAREIL